MLLTFNSSPFLPILLPKNEKKKKKKKKNEEKSSKRLFFMLFLREKARGRALETIICGTINCKCKAINQPKALKVFHDLHKGSPFTMLHALIASTQLELA